MSDKTEMREIEIDELRECLTDPMFKSLMRHLARVEELEHGRHELEHELHGAVLQEAGLRAELASVTAEWDNLAAAHKQALAATERANAIRALADIDTGDETWSFEAWLETVATSPEAQAYVDALRTAINVAEYEQRRAQRDRNGAIDRAEKAEAERDRLSAAMREVDWEVADYDASGAMPRCLICGGVVSLAGSGHFDDCPFLAAAAIRTLADDGGDR